MLQKILAEDNCKVSIGVWFINSSTVLSFFPHRRNPNGEWTSQYCYWKRALLLKLYNTSTHGGLPKQKECKTCLAFRQCLFLFLEKLDEDVVTLNIPIIVSTRPFNRIILLFGKLFAYNTLKTLTNTFILLLTSAPWARLCKKLSLKFFCGNWKKIVVLRLIWTSVYHCGTSYPQFSQILATC